MVSSSKGQFSIYTYLHTHYLLHTYGRRAGGGGPASWIGRLITHRLLEKDTSSPGEGVQHLLERNEEETIITDNLTGVRCRVIKNRFSESLVEMANNGDDPWKIMKAGVGKMRKAYVGGDIEWGSLMFGQVCGLINEVPTCQELIDAIVEESETVMKSLGDKILR